MPAFVRERRGAGDRQDAPPTTGYCCIDERAQLPAGWRMQCCAHPRRRHVPPNPWLMQHQRLCPCANTAAYENGIAGGVAAFPGFQQRFFPQVRAREDCMHVEQAINPWSSGMCVRPVQRPQRLHQPEASLCRNNALCRSRQQPARRQRQVVSRAAATVLSAYDDPILQLFLSRCADIHAIAIASALTPLRGCRSLGLACWPTRYDGCCLHQAQRGSNPQIGRRVNPHPQCIPGQRLGGYSWLHHHAAPWAEIHHDSCCHRFHDGRAAAGVLKAARCLHALLLGMFSLHVFE